MNFTDQNLDAGDMDDESRDRLALTRTWKLLKNASSSPAFCSAAELHLMIRMSIVRAPSAFQPREAVAKIVSGLTITQHKRLRSGLLKFYASDGNLAEAAKYVPKNEKLTASEYEPAIRVHLANGNLKAAKSVAERCQTFAAANINNGSELSGDVARFELRAALAAYYARTGERVKAMAFWGSLVPSDRLYSEAVRGMVCSRIVDALLMAHDGIDELLNQQGEGQFVFDAVPLADALDRRSQTVEMLQKIRDSLLQLLSLEQKAAFGLGARPQFKPSDGEGC